MSTMKKIGIVGNPNSGKSSIFNILTGLNQKVGNFPGVTVDSKEGLLELLDGTTVNLIDFPGAYSIFSNSSDEFVMTKSLVNPNDPHYPDAILYVADIRNLDKQLLLLTHILDLEFPVIVCLSNIDQVNQTKVNEWVLLLEQKLKCPVIPVSARANINIDILRTKLQGLFQFAHIHSRRDPIYEFDPSLLKDTETLDSMFSFRNNYQKYLWLHVGKEITGDHENRMYLDKQTSIRMQIHETMARFQVIESWERFISDQHHSNTSLIKSKKIDRVLTNPFFGLAIFLVLMFFIFQVIYSWAAIPMEAIESGFGFLSDNIRNILPNHWISQLITSGILPGLSGVLVFIPQIAMLFLMLTLLEEAGYMARVVYLLDHLLRKFGLNGRSIVGLVAGGACAIPAIMSTRNISNRKERLITMFVIPLIPCSARIPVYTALIGFVVPYTMVFGIFNSQGIAFLGLYLLGIFVALITAAVIHYFLPEKERSFLALQLPEYQIPQMRQVLLVVFEKVKTFIIQAGKVILIISMILWFLSSFSWPGELKKAEELARVESLEKNLSEKETANLQDAKRLEYSFAGKMGKLFEPLIRPLGFDWKIGIALITSFAAREVFVGTMSTIYSLGGESDEANLHKKLASEKRPDGSIFFDRKTALSLIIFYAFSLQCMSTLAVMKRETKGWKLPIIQFIYMGILAYFCSLMIYQYG